MKKDEIKRAAQTTAAAMAGAAIGAGAVLQMAESEQPENGETTEDTQNDQHETNPVNDAQQGHSGQHGHSGQQHTVQQGHAAQTGTTTGIVHDTQPTNTNNNAGEQHQTEDVVTPVVTPAPPVVVVEPIADPNVRPEDIIVEPEMYGGPVNPIEDIDPEDDVLMYGGPGYFGDDILTEDLYNEESDETQNQESSSDTDGQTDSYMDIDPNLI